MTQHSFYMQRAIELARRGIGFTSPNPLVGAVIVRDGIILGEGYHARYGDLHAERNALRACSVAPVGATLYVTLEPCCHYGKQPPCTDAILQSGIRTVYIGSRDPNPLVAGKGTNILRDAGIEVHTDFMREACDALNPIFFHYITQKTPYVILKYAMTTDGKIACSNGKSQWVTGKIAREHTHQTRKRVAAIAVGIGTVLTDDPLLTCRCDNPHNPIRVVFDTHLRIPLSSRLVQTAKDIPTIVLAHMPDNNKRTCLEFAGVNILDIPLQDNHISFSDAMIALGQRGIDSILVEGGASLNASALRSGLVNFLQVYIAPKIFGGDAISPISALNILSPQDAYQFASPKITSLADDVLLEFTRKA